MVHCCDDVKSTVPAGRVRHGMYSASSLKSDPMLVMLYCQPPSQCVWKMHSGWTSQRPLSSADVHITCRSQETSQSDLEPGSRQAGAISRNARLLLAACMQGYMWRHAHLCWESIQHKDHLPGPEPGPARGRCMSGDGATPIERGAQADAVPLRSVGSRSDLAIVLTNPSARVDGEPVQATCCRNPVLERPIKGSRSGQLYSHPM